MLKWVLGRFIRLPVGLKYQVSRGGNRVKGSMLEYQEMSRSLQGALDGTKEIPESLRDVLKKSLEISGVPGGTMRSQGHFRGTYLGLYQAVSWAFQLL